MQQIVGPLEFNLTFDPWDDKLKVFQIDKEYNCQLKIRPQNSNYSHRGIDFEFCTEMTPCGSKPIKIQQNNLRLSESGTITENTFFNLPKLSFPEYTQTYHGSLFTVKHYIRVWVRKLIGSELFEQELEAYKIIQYATTFEPLSVRAQVGDSLFLEYLITRRKYDFDDVILGQVRFKDVSIQLKILRVQIVAQETLEVNGVPRKFKNILNYWEIAYGSPVKNESIPFRLFLAPVNISPSCANPKIGYSVTHYLHFTMVAASGEKYYKSLQITFNKMNRPPFYFTGEDDELLESLKRERLKKENESAEIANGDEFDE